MSEDRSEERAACSGCSKPPGDTAGLRIGTCEPRPRDERALSTSLSPDDCARLVDASLRSEALEFAVVWGVSANTRRWWSLAARW
ncbi:MAG TPA: hypothetical protein VK816_10565 [Jatrophihabitantaceae bacterium]|jgi:uronate dehydrogenase|nr:hypothetical protein [Jatrophihabitantaceae bacterium]